MKTVIITGASGLLGQHLCQYFATNYKVVGLYNSTEPKFPEHIKTICVDLAQSSSLSTIIHQIKPDFLIHAAGYTSVDECELNPEIAKKQNVVCTRNICEAIKDLNTKLVLISTDHLFSGMQSNYSEDSIVGPLNIYAETKLNAELEVLKIENSLVIRTNFYGGHTTKKMSFSSWILDQLNQGKIIKMFDDVFFTPISICSLAENLELIINSPCLGIYNIAGSERLSKYAFALKLAEVFQLPQNLILKTSVNNFNFRAERPRDMSLSIAKIIKELDGFHPETVTEGLKKIKSFNLI